MSKKKKKKVAYSGAVTQATRVVAQSLPVTVICPLTLICPLTIKASIWHIILYSDFKAKRLLSRKTWDAVQGLISHHIIAHSEILMVALE